MQWHESIDTKGNISSVYHAYTSGQFAQIHGPEITDFWEISDTPGLIGSQSGWLFLHGRSCLEVIETLVSQDPPNSIHSTIVFTRLLPLPKEMLRKHEFAVVGDELASIFRATYGSNQPTGELVATFEATATGTRITQSLDLKIGGTTGFFTRFSKFAKRSPLTAKLTAFRDSYENDAS